MKTIILLLISCIILNFNRAASCKENIRDENIKLIIDSIHMGPMAGDIKPSEFSVIIHFKNEGKNILNWQLGFYMAGAPLARLVSGSQNINPRLVRQICDSKNHCISLKYDIAKKIPENDLSQGYTTIHSPLETFPLTKGEAYTIKLLHINQWGGCNVSYFPQNFFLLLEDNNPERISKRNVYPLDTNFHSYKIVNYDQKKIDIEIKEHIQSNWYNSANNNKICDDLDIVPNPTNIKIKKGNYLVLNDKININNEFNDNYKVLSVAIKNLETDLKIRTTTNQQRMKSADILIQQLTDPEVVKNNYEGYTIDIDSHKIIIKALTEAGVYYAFQTLRQLWIYGGDGLSTKIPQLQIIDYPQFKYRGILLDTARHFFSVSEIKSLIDLMATHKLNTLHLHFSDDEAFRIALPFYPSVQSVGDSRGFGLPMGPMMFPQGNLYETYKDPNYIGPDAVYSGTYSSRDIFEIVKYANLNQITVIPEIDFPAHARALIKSMPNVFVDANDSSKYISAQGYSDDVLPICTYNTNISVGPKFTEAIDRIVSLVAELFNGQTTVYAIKNEISVGGDEVSPNAWTKSPSCKGGWSKLSALQKSHKFFKEVAKMNPGIILSGWQQFVQTDGVEIGTSIVPANKVGHVWVWNSSESGIPQAIHLANNGFPVVLAFSDKTYFDLVYTPDIKEMGFAWATNYSDTHAALSSAKAVTRVVSGTEAQFKEKILGLEGALWSEHLANYNQLVYMALPKMAGLAEASWSPSARTHDKQILNWQSLAKRLGCGEKGFLSYLNRLYGVHYRGYPEGIKLEVPQGMCP